MNLGQFLDFCPFYWKIVMLCHLLQAVMTLPLSLCANDFVSVHLPGERTPLSQRALCGHTWRLCPCSRTPSHKALAPGQGMGGGGPVFPRPSLTPSAFIVGVCSPRQGARLTDKQMNLSLPWFHDTWNHRTPWPWVETLSGVQTSSAH